MPESDLDLDLEELSSAEDFLDYFGVEYEPAVVHVNRLHILQRFHDYVGQAGEPAWTEGEKRSTYRDLLARAYQDFVTSDALTEKVFKVFHGHEPQTVFVPLDEVKGRSKDASSL